MLSRQGLSAFGWVIIILAVPVAATEIRLRGRAASQGTLVLLGDVADISAGGQEQVDQLKRLELFPAPSRGQVRVLRLHEVREFLLLNNFDVKDVRFTGAASVRVTPRIRPAAAPQVAVESLTTAEPAPQWYVVTTRPISPGERIRERDVTLQPQPKTAAAGRQYLRNADDAVGFEATRGLAAGRPVEVGSLRAPILVRRREIVTVVSRSSGVRVRTEARALEDGSLGSLVALESISSRERYTARVTGTGQVEVFAGAVSVSRPAPAPQRLAPQRLSARRTES